MNTSSSKSIVVMGAGAWGTALALQAHNAGNTVSLWAYLQDERDAILHHRENTLRLPGVHIPKEIDVSTDLAVVKHADFALVVTPAQSIRAFLSRLKPYLSDHTKLVFCSKGIEIESGELISKIAHDSLPNHRIGFLSGPNFAKEIALGATGANILDHKSVGATSVAFESLEDAQGLAHALSSENFRVYPNADSIGVQIGGAYKNVLAIAAGILKGVGFGENALAALVTRGVMEMTRFAVHNGADPMTIMGMSGVGDLMLCCYSTTSRNMALGVALGDAFKNNKDLKTILENDNKPLTEGAFTVRALHKLASKDGLDLPICQAVYDVLFASKSVKTVIEALLARPVPTQELYI